jgi:hypothetical protein
VRRAGGGDTRGGSVRVRSASACGRGLGMGLDYLVGPVKARERVMD